MPFNHRSVYSPEQPAEQDLERQAARLEGHLAEALGDRPLIQRTQGQDALGQPAARQKAGAFRKFSR